MIMTGRTDHGGGRFAASQRTGIPEDRLLDFSASISPRGVSGTVLRAIRRTIRQLPHYPDTRSGELSAAIEKRYRLKRGAVICGNGSTELIYLVARALRPDRVLLTAPTFSEYERACKASGTSRVVYHELRREEGFCVSPDEFIRHLAGGAGNNGSRAGVRKRCDLAFLCNPNNPTGQLLARRDVVRIANAARKLKCHLVVDEAFADFCPGNSVMDAVRTNPYLIVLRSLTKFHALAGLRIGYAAVPPSIAERMMQVKEPWSVNVLAQSAGIAALKDTRYANAVLKDMRREKAFIERRLAKERIEYVPSCANYYLIRLPDAHRVIDGLERKGILVRGCGDFRGLDRSYLRFAVRSARENRILMHELAAAAREEGI